MIKSEQEGVMREILFRGKNYKGEWLYGSLQQWYDTFGGDIKSQIHPVELEPTQQGGRVDSATIGQFTGLTDKNGKRVFEGDIVKHNNTHFVVEFSANHLGFICIDRKHKTRGGFANWRDGNWMKNVSSYIQVIGNIHDNKMEDIK